MNTLSKYDIADVVSHITGNTGATDTQATDTEAADRSPFGALLAKAIENIPDSKAEGKVTEGGKNLPDYSAPGLEQDGENKLKNSLNQVSQGERAPDLDLARALFAPFMRNHEFSSPPELASQTKVNIEGSEGGKELEISEALQALRSSSQIQVRSQNVLATEGTDSLDRVRSSEKNISESAVRITTLKQKRPVILGPGHIMGGTFQGEALANDFENLSLRNGEHSSDISGLIGGGAKSGSIRSESASREKTTLETQLEKLGTSEKNSALRSQAKVTSRNHAELSDSEKGELPPSNNSALGALDIADIRSMDNVDKAAQHFENSKIYKNLGDHTDIEQLDNSEKNLAKVKNGKANVQPTSGEPNIIANNQAPPVQGKPIKTEGLIISSNEKRKAERPAAPDAALQPIISKDSSALDGRLSASAVPKIDKHELHKLAEKFPGSLVGKQRHAGTNKDSDKSISSDFPIDIDSRKPDRMTGKSGDANVGARSEIEKNSLKISSKNSIEISMNNDQGAIKAVSISAASPVQDLTLQDVDSNINSAKSDNIEPTGREVLIGSQIDKVATANRSELLSKPVSVSNFNSDIQETIVGQLTNSAKGTSKFTVALFPENFGKISIEISYSEAAGLKINMIGDNPEAAKILEQNLPSLRENLQSEKLSELIVNLNSNKDSHGSNNKNGQPDGGSLSESLMNEKVALESEDSDVGERDRGLDSESNLDTYV